MIEQKAQFKHTLPERNGILSNLELSLRAYSSYVEMVESDDFDGSYKTINHEIELWEQEFIHWYNQMWSYSTSVAQKYKTQFDVIKSRHGGINAS